jgi:DNA polymerase/3'-5' exonuclease PolX
MAKEKKWNYEEALRIAERVLDEIKPHAYRAEIAGSIRRKKPLVGDIEIVCIPKPYEWGLLADGLALVVNQWKMVKGKMIYGKVKYTQRILPEGIKLDLFFCEPENWGLTYAVRTGSAGYSYSTLACGWSRAGYTSKDNYLHHKKTGERIEIREEIDLFHLIRKPYKNPEDRG